jgi:simple sugar transport system substrate-binding protein
VTIVSRLVVPAAAVAFALIAAGCDGGKQSAETAQPATTASTSAQPPAGRARRGVRIVVVTHGQASDPFWAVVKRGIDKAARDLGVTVAYQAPDSYEAARVSRLIDTAVATKPDGLVVSIPDATGVGPSIRLAVQAGIPVVAINSGEDVYRRLGALLYIG